MDPCLHPHHRHPLTCIIPPHMLENIAENGTPEQRAMALDTLAATQSLLGQRLAVTRGSVAFESKAQPVETAEAIKQRYVYTANFARQLPGKLVRQEAGEASGDACVDEAFDGAGLTYDLYWSEYQRNSIDNRGMPLISTVHFDSGYDNAFWNGKQMVYGDGDEDLPPDQRIFNRFTIALDVIAHELTHGVTQYESNLVYYNQPGALNESLSDVFGVLVKQHRLGQTARAADWIIGAGLFTGIVNGAGIRSMKAPGTAYNDPVLGKDPQPGHMDNFVKTTQDNGGVHINSGIPNRAFYRTAVELDGYAWEKAGQIWYRSMTDRRLANSASFLDFATLTHTVAAERYGTNSLEQRAVRLGWSEVGILLDAPSGPLEPPVEPPVNTGGQGSGCLQAVLRLFSPSQPKK